VRRGCGLLADGQTCQQLVIRESATAAATTRNRAVAGCKVVLSEVHDLCCSVRQGEMVLIFVRSGNKVGSVAGLS
jgi:hypothetical protein